MENGIGAKEDYKPYTVEYSLIRVRKEAYRPSPS
jgi:hypothetical protein